VLSGAAFVGAWHDQTSSGLIQELDPGVHHMLLHEIVLGVKFEALLVAVEDTQSVSSRSIRQIARWRSLQSSILAADTGTQSG